MQPIKINLSSLFGNERLYVVPSYQRLYVWNADNQWQPLWLDVQEKVDALLATAVDNRATEVKAASVEDHFLGAVVMKIAGPTDDLTEQWRVIDGQQRLTTLQLLLAASVAALDKLDITNRATTLRNLLQNSTASTGTGREFKIRHYHQKQDDSYSRFIDVISAALHGESTDDIQGPMAECYKHFFEQIMEWFDKHPDHTDIAGSALATALVFKLSLVAIVLDEHESEHVIFETLNARGAILTEWDKVKNYLLYQADEEEEIRVNQDEFFVQYLERFDDPWWRREVGRGAQQRPRTDVFVDYWLESRLQGPVEVRSVFREFQKHRKSGKQSLESLTKDLIQDAAYFRRFEVDATDSSREALFHHRRLQMGVGAFWPLLFQLQRLSEDAEERGRWFGLLESYLVRRMIAGYQARSYDQVAMDLLARLEEAQDRPVRDTIYERLDKYAERGNLWPSDSELRDRILDRELPGYAQNLVLGAVEAYLLKNARPSHITLEPNVQIEHIMPKEWKANWPLDPPPETSVEEETRNKSRDKDLCTLGNLTLVSEKLNPSLSNAAFSEKRVKLEEFDNLLMTRHLLRVKDAKGDGNRWTEDDIRERGEWMYEQIVRIWPRG